MHPKPALLSICLICTVSEVDDHPTDDLTFFHLVNNIIDLTELPGVDNWIDPPVSRELEGLGQVLPGTNQGTDDLNPVEDGLGYRYVNVTLW